MTTLWTPERAIAWERDAKMARLGKQFADFGASYMSPNNPGAAPPPGPPAAVNPPFSTVKSLIHLDDGSGDTSFDDVILGANTWNRISAGTTEAAALKFGTTGFSAASGTGYVKTTSGVALGSGQFQAEGWAAVDVQNASCGICSLGMLGDGLSVSFNFGAWYVTDMTSFSDIISVAGSTAAAGTFFHWGVSRSSTNVIRLFVGGVLIGSASNTSNYTGTTMCYGFDDWNGLFGMRYVDECRMAKGAGSCTYTAAFTPPSSAFPDS